MGLLDRLRRHVPSPEAVRANRWVRWLGPSLHHPRLWHVSRRGIALGVGIGVFFGLLIPIAQMPLAAGAAVLLRANVPTAVASTLVTNPVTFGPIYYGAWRIGSWILAPQAPPPAPPATGAGAAAVVLPTPAPALQARIDAARARGGVVGWVQQAFWRVVALGRPLLLGMALMATTCGLLAWAAVSAAWHWRVRRKRRRRLRGRAAGPGQG